MVPLCDLLVIRAVRAFFVRKSVIYTSLIV